MSTETKTTTTQNTATENRQPKGELTFNDKVIQKVVGYAIEKVTGLLGVDGGFVSVDIIKSFL